MKIHPTAVIDPGARLGTDVEVGPYSLIGPLVTIGDRSVIRSHVVLEGAVEIGTDNVIGPGSIIGGAPQDLGFKPETQSRVVIGNNNIIREHCTVHRGTMEGSATVIGDGNFLMTAVHIGHNSQVGNGIIMANNSLLGGHVQIQDRAFLGGGATFHQYVHVGRLAMVQGRSGFSKDIPPFVIGAIRNVVVGVNVIGLRRAGFSATERDEIKRAFKLLYRSGLNARQAVEEAATLDFGPLGREFFDFVANARKRGIAPFREGHEEW